MSEIIFATNQDMVLIDALNEVFTGNSANTVAPHKYVNGKVIDVVVSLCTVNKAFDVEVDKSTYIKDAKGNVFYKILGARPSNIRKR